MAIEKEIDIKVDSKDAEQGFAKLADAINDLNKTFSKFSEDTKDGLEDINNTSKKTEKGVGGIAKGFKGLGVAIKAAGIGLVIGVLTTLKEVFTSNQKVADLFATAFETVSLVFNSFVETIVEVVEKVNEATGGFDALKKVVGGLLTIAITPLKLSFFAIKLGLQEAQLAWEQSFFGDKDPTTIKELNAAIKETRNDLADVAVAAVDAGKQVADNIVEAVGEVTTLVTESIDGVSKISVSAAYEAAKVNVQLANSAELAAVKNQGLIEQYDRQAEQLRQIRDDESKSIEDRIKANEDLAKVLDKQEEAMLKNAEIQVAAAAAELSKNKNSIELQKAYLEALNEQAAIEAQITGFRSEQQTNVNSLLREQKDIQKELALIGKSERDVEREELKQQYEEQKELINKQVSDDAERKAILLESERVYNEQLKELNAQFIQEDLDAQKEKADKEKEIEDKALADKLAIIQAEQSAREANLATISSGLNGLQNVFKAFGKESKELAIASIVVDQVGAISRIISNTGIANAKAVAASPVTLGQPWVTINTISAAASIAGSIAGAGKSIAALKGDKKTPLSSTIPTQGASGGNVSAPSIPPAFNVVGASGTSQLAEAIGEQEQQPVQAYVVANDVTTAQSMDRNIVEGASIG